MPTNNNELFAKFLNALLHAQKLSPMTVTGYRWKMGQFLRWIDKHHGGKFVTEWTYADFEDFLSEMKWGSPSSAHSFVTKCHRFIKWCNARGVVVPDFTGGYKAPKAVRGKPKCISREDLVRLLAGAKTYGVGCQKTTSASAGVAGG